MAEVVTAFGEVMVLDFTSTRVRSRGNNACIEQQFQLHPAIQLLIAIATMHIELPLLQTLEPDAETRAIKIQDLEMGFAAVDEHEQLPAGGLFL